MKVTQKILSATAFAVPYNIKASPGQLVFGEDMIVLPRVLYCYHALPMGLATAPGVFQGHMSTILESYLMSSTVSKSIHVA